MYKQALLLGLLMEKPMYGQQIRELIEHHHDLFADYMKKPTIYYQLDRLVQEGYLEVRREQVEAPGPGGAHSDLACANAMSIILPRRVVAISPRSCARC